MSTEDHPPLQGGRGAAAKAVIGEHRGGRRGGGHRADRVSGNRGNTAEHAPRGGTNNPRLGADSRGRGRSGGRGERGGSRGRGDRAIRGSQPRQQWQQRVPPPESSAKVEAEDLCTTYTTTASVPAPVSPSTEHAAWSGATPESMTLTAEQSEEQERRARAEVEAEAEMKQEEQRQMAASLSAARLPSPRLRKILDEETNDMLERPSTGTLGRAVNITCNHFSFMLKVGSICQYCVEFKPEVESKSARNRYLYQHEAMLGQFIFDGGAMLFLTKRTEDTELRCKAADGSDVRILVTLIKELSQPSIHLAGLMFNKILRILNLKQVSRQYFDPTRPINIPQYRVQLWPGYFTSVAPSQMGIMLIADVAHKVLRTDTVLDFLYEAQHTKRQGYRSYVASQLIGSIVITRYNNRTYRIDDIDWNKSPRSKFQRSSGDMISYLDYYRISYNRDMISDLDQPLLVHRNKRKGNEDKLIYLIPELCNMTGLTDDMRQDFMIMSELAKHIRMGPDRRKREVEDFIQSINQNPEVQMKLITEWGLHMNHVAPQINARVLGSERLHFGDKSIQVDATAEWMQAMSRQKISGTNLVNWLFIYSNRVQREATEFARKLSHVGRDIGLQVSDAQHVVLNDDRPASFIASAKNSISNRTQIVVFLLNGARKDVYDKMKQLCCLDIPIPSQAILTRSIKNPKRMMSVCKNILLQINCKQGGELWHVDIPLTGRTMVVGIDVYHNTGPGGGRNSVAGFIATTNATFTKYYSRVAFQDKGQELMSKLRACMVDALKYYFKANQSLPDRILVYRDGVGDGQLAAVLDQEVPQLQEAFSEVGESYKPKLAVIVVKKRIHTRLFLPGGQGQGLGNVQPGTVVDSGIVHPSWYDFFLVSQFVRQGTVTPTHYHVIVDDTGLSPDVMQQLTYKLCHLYFNWPGTIRVPAPCQYAHKIAFLVGQSLHKQPAVVLSDRLFFL